jgi:hypothetical protein
MQLQSKNNWAWLVSIYAWRKSSYLENTQNNAKVLTLRVKKVSKSAIRKKY